MMSLNFYAVMNKETNVLSSFFMSGDDKEASKFIFDSLDKAFVGLNEKDKDVFISSVRGSCIVRVGNVDLIEHHLSDDFNVLVDLKDFKKECVKENAAS